MLGRSGTRPSSCSTSRVPHRANRARRACGGVSRWDPDNCRMSDASRIRGHLTWSVVDLRLRAMREIWVAMTRPDGRPHAVPVWFWWSGASLYFTARAGTLKPRSLAAAPSIVVHNGDGVDPIIIAGTATVVTQPDELD